MKRRAGEEENEEAPSHGGTECREEGESTNESRSMIVSSEKKKKKTTSELSATMIMTIDRSVMGGGEREEHGHRTNYSFRNATDV